MKIALVIGFAFVCILSTETSWAAIPPPTATSAAPVALVTPPPPPTLTQDLEYFYQLVPMKMVMKLVTRYLLNDAEFQAFVRTVNSHDAFMLRLRLRSQPEVVAFQAWANSQMLLSGGPLEMEEIMEIPLFTMSNFWSGNTYGWQGFLNELSLYYPIDLVRAHIDMKVLENGIFAQFWQRLGALKPVYERILLTPEAKRLITQLNISGIDVNQLDHLIRTQCNWNIVPVASTTAAPVAPVANGAQAPPSAAQVVV